MITSVLPAIQCRSIHDDDDEHDRSDCATLNHLSLETFCMFSVPNNKFRKAFRTRGSQLGPCFNKNQDLRNDWFFYLANNESTVNYGVILICSIMIDEWGAA